MGASSPHDRLKPNRVVGVITEGFGLRVAAATKGSN